MWALAQSVGAVGVFGGALMHEPLVSDATNRVVPRLGWIKFNTVVSFAFLT